MGEKMRPPRVLSLFSGAGGLDVGFAQAGFDIAVSSDIEEDFLQTIDLNVGRYFPTDHRSIPGDVTQLQPDIFGEVGDFDFLIGGPPCQTFSAAGRRAGGVSGINDFRGSLFWHYARLIDHFGPSGFLFENVRGLLQANKGHDWRVISDHFRSLGYELSYRVLDAADYGVPQHRERVIVVGMREGEYLFPRPTHGPDSPNSQPFVTAGEALADIDDPDEEVPPYGGKYGDLLMEVPPGENYLYFTEEMGYPEPKFAWRSRFSDFLYKASPDSPTKTIVASQGRYGGPFHWRGRKFTVDELKRLQSFPPDYEFFGGYGLVVKQIGNSVAPRFAYELAKSVASQVFGLESDQPQELLPSNYKLSFDSRKARKARRTRQARQHRVEATQPTLFVEDASIDWPEATTQHRWAYQTPRKREADASNPLPDFGSFEVRETLHNGHLAIDVRRVLSDSAEEPVIELDLAFDQPVAGSFKTVAARLISDSPWDVSVAWDAVHDAIANHTSYDSLHPLYGHFTEPYPKFDLKVTRRLSDDPMADFIDTVADFDFLAGPRPLAELAELFAVPETAAIQLAKKLRASGFDIRVHQTNRTIPKGYFRVCYPFTMPVTAPNFVVWREIGTHKTADHSDTSNSSTD